MDKCHEAETAVFHHDIVAELSKLREVFEKVRIRSFVRDAADEDLIKDTSE